MGAMATQEEKNAVREQLSGACTTEIASFDEFTSLLAVENSRYDHIIFDTAPSGHTLRLLSLPQAWSGFLAGNDKGASCLGPHSGLKMQEARFNQALVALRNPALTSVVLVARPETSALKEAARTSVELKALGLSQQRLIINGVFHTSVSDDPVAKAVELQGRNALANIPDALKELPQDEVPLRAEDNVGLSALRALLSESAPVYSQNPPKVEAITAKQFSLLLDDLSTLDHGLIMVMEKAALAKPRLLPPLRLAWWTKERLFISALRIPQRMLLKHCKSKYLACKSVELILKQKFRSTSTKSCQPKGQLSMPIKKPCSLKTFSRHALKR